MTITSATQTNTRNRRLFNFLRRVVASLYIGLILLEIVLAWRRLNPYDPSWLRVRESGVLRIGIDPTYPPFGAFAPDGSVFGLDVDLGNAIAEYLGVRAQFIPLGIDGLYSALQTNTVDVLISALALDPLRFTDVWYSPPYIDAGAVIVARPAPGGGPPYPRMEALDGARVAVEYGSQGDAVARRYSRRLRALDIVRFVQPDEALEAVLRGEADAAIIDHISALLYRRAHPDAPLVIAPDAAFPDPYAVAVKLTGRELAGKVNAAMQELRNSGQLAAILARWL